MEFIMPAIEIVFNVVLLGALAYFLLHQAAANCFELATYRVLPFYNVSLVLREGIGVCVRWYRKLPTYAALDRAEDLLQLGDASDESVLLAYRRLEASMLNSPWAYPDSQHEAVTYVAWEFNVDRRLQANLEYFRIQLGQATAATKLQET
jgi:hypothetical protein